MAASLNLSEMRLAYNPEGHDPLDVSSLPAREPFANFQAWLNEAITKKAVEEPNAMCLSTSSLSGQPSARIVLLKGFDKTGFKFFTNYSSRKGTDLADNPQASPLFYWEPMRRQIRIEGTVTKLPSSECDEYFHSRPRGSQIGAAASEQSKPIQNRAIFDEKVAELEKLYEGKQVKRPDNWGGYALSPVLVEFWQGNANRLHDRIVFVKPNNSLNRETHTQQTNDKVADECCGFDKKFLNSGDDGWFFLRLSP